jgi:hypothetical protein
MLALNPILPTVPAGLCVDRVTLDAACLAITARTIGPDARCPACGQATPRVHSRYWRKVADPPWHDRTVPWRIQVRRFRCCHCPGRIFAERLPSLTAAKARRSGWLARAQTEIGLMLGGEAGARLSHRLAMPVSGDTVLRLIRRQALLPCPAPRVVGVDDWAWRRGRRYGTIVCDLERHRVIDLLPGRSAAPIRRWLAAHPGITVISRDRAGPYADAARSGAPGATQVADRWHLLVNASEALRRIVERHQPQIREAAQICTRPATTPPTSATASPKVVPSDRRQTRFAAVARLHAEGISIKGIVRRTGVARNAVRRWLRAGEFVPYRRAPGASMLDRRRAFLAKSAGKRGYAGVSISIARSGRAALRAATISSGAGLPTADRRRIPRPNRRLFASRRHAGPHGS